MQITNGEILVDAKLLAKLLAFESAGGSSADASPAITSICEKGLDEHQGQYRLSFFYQNRRARLNIDRIGTYPATLDRKFRPTAIAARTAQPRWHTKSLFFLQ